MEIKYNIEGDELKSIINDAIQKEVAKAVAEEVVKNIDTEKIINEILQDKTMFFDRIVDATTGVLAERIINIVVASYIKKNKRMKKEEDKYGYKGQGILFL